MRLLVPLLLALAASNSLHAAPQGCPACVPLSDLGSGTYQGFEGGLYPGGRNEVPAAHEATARRLLGNVVPRDGFGEPDPDGLVGFLSVGMSNASQEFSAFLRRADRDAGRDARLVVVDGAEAAQGAEFMAQATNPYWDRLVERVELAGLRREQVQVVWLKQARTAVTDTSFPAHAEALEADLTTIVLRLRSEFPALAVVFLSSRVYGGFSGGAYTREPLAYETGFAVKWLIERQLGGDPALNPDPLAGPVEAPLLLWGPYLWANGAMPRSDGLSWEASDFTPDGVHPSLAGEEKVASLIEAFFRTDPLAGPLYDPRDGAALETLDALHDASVDDLDPGARLGLDPLLPVADGARRAFVRFAAPQGAGEVVHGKFGVQALVGAAPMAAFPVDDTSWDEARITGANAPPVTGPALGTFSCSCRVRAIGFEVTDLLRNASPLGVGLALVPLAGSVPFQLLSREGGVAPSLVVTRDTACGGVEPFCAGAVNSTGAGAALAAQGSVSVASNDLALRAAGLPPGAFGLLFYSRGTAALPLGDGLLCAAAPLYRVTILQADAAGDASHALDLTAPPAGSGPGQVLAGDRVHFQLWYRDVAGPGMTGFNLSGGLTVRFCP